MNVETDKIVMEVPAEATGVLLKILNFEDSELKIGAPIAIIGREGESFDEILNEIQDELEATGAKASAESISESRTQPRPGVRRGVKELSTSTPR